MADTGDTLMTIEPFPEAEPPKHLPRGLAAALKELEDDPEPEEELAPEAAGSLQLLADVAAGKDYTTRGPTGKIIKQKPDLAERMRAATSIVKLTGDLTASQAMTALGMGPAESTTVNLRQLARQICALVIEWKMDFQDVLPPHLFDAERNKISRAELGDKLAALAVQKLSEGGTPAQMMKAALKK